MEKKRPHEHTRAAIEVQQLGLRLPDQKLTVMRPQ